MTDEIFRVYRPEWLIMHSLIGQDDHTTGDQLTVRLCEYFDEHFYGRVRPEDVRITGHGTAGLTAIAYLQLRLPNLKAEFKARGRAESYVAERGWFDAVIVARNSVEDHDLRSYSKSKLPEIAA